MKNKILPVLFIPVFFAALGCGTPPEPPVPAPVPAPPPKEVIVEVVKEVPVYSPSDTLMPVTPFILQQIGKYRDLTSDIGKYQFVLFGRVLLESEYTEKKVENEKGTAKFENTRVREQITIADQTEGIALAMDTMWGETVLYVCFEDDDQYMLQFSAVTEELDSYFYLRYDPELGTAAIGDEKGILVYGGAEYKLKFAGDKQPYLLIRLSQEDKERLTERKATGRKVETADKE
ncbi:MAG: hypothetical protein FWH38_05360 [Treponema sp.]|nr:hypothetical protein [Treponema sp.]